MTAAERTRSLTAPPSIAIDEGVRWGIRDRLSAELASLVGDLPPGERIVVTLPLLRRAGVQRVPSSRPVEPFAWKPAFIRRSLGLAVVESCIRRRFRSPLEAVGPVATDAVAAWERTGWRTFHWEPWMARLAPGARAAVLSEAATWATSLWSSFDWDAFEQIPQVRVADDHWVCPETSTVRLRGRAELRVPLASVASARPETAEGDDPVALVSVSGGCPGPAWREELAFLALVRALRSPSRPVPSRVMGLWPGAGDHRTAEIDGDVLDAAADRVTAVVGSIVDGRLVALQNR